MATPTFVQALKGTVSLNGSLFNALQFDITFTAQLEDITYTTSGGATFGVHLPGYVIASGTVNFVYDTSNQPVISPFALQPNSGTTPIAAIFTPDGTKPFSCNIFSESLNFSSGPQAGPASKCSLSFKSTGTITYPTS